MTRIAVLTSIGRTLDAFFPPIIARWRESGVDVITASADASVTQPHTRLRTITRSPRPKNLLTPNEIANWISREKPTVLLTNTAVASFLSRLQPSNCPVIYFCHGLHWDSGRGLGDRIWQILERFALRNTSAVVTINSDDQAWFQRHAPMLPIMRLSAGVGVPTNQFPRSPLPHPAEPLSIVWAGEFSHRKRPMLAVEVMRALSALTPSLRLTMCGDGPLIAETRRHAISLGLQDRVLFPGQVSDLPERLANAHALLMTSTWEGLPRIALEANAVGRPVFAFDVKGVRSLPQVFLSADQDVSELARLIHSHAQHGFRDFQPVEHGSLDSARSADDLLGFLTRIQSGE